MPKVTVAFDDIVQQCGGEGQFISKQELMQIDKSGKLFPFEDLDTDADGMVAPAEWQCFIREVYARKGSKGKEWLTFVLETIQRNIKRLQTRDGSIAAAAAGASTRRQFRIENMHHGNSHTSAGLFKACLFYGTDASPYQCGRSSFVTCGRCGDQ
jgi:hypothetical protein